MKRIVFIILCSIGVVSNMIGQNYYWYKNQKLELKEGDMSYILYDNSSMHSKSLLMTSGPVAENKNIEWGIISNKSIINFENVIYKTNSFLLLDDTTNTFVTHHFYVKLKSQQDYAILQDFSKKHNAIIERKGTIDLWYVLTCDINGEYNALDLANIFYESHLFAASEPEFIYSIKSTCANDQFFSQQWNLSNSGQYGSDYAGIDIHFCNARNITEGESSIIVGVYDKGVDLNHPDLNIYPTSFDTYTQSSPSVICSYHGTACAGIISAKTNNNMGIAGISPNCPIMSISMRGACSGDQLASGFAYAADNGCSVISNSWKSVRSNSLDDAIAYALENGRNGLGCVVVFASGNDNEPSIVYPANSNPEIIVVGAMSPCGERKDRYSCDNNWQWGSNYGAELDIVAPGAKIPTTDNTSGGVYIWGEDLTSTGTPYIHNFQGTSAACPHVAAVAALILSINPTLTQQEVANIIESTANKVGDYTYTLTSGRPNGTWNNEMGYGLLDANAAVRSLCEVVEVSDTTFNANTTLSGCVVTLEDVNVQNNKTINISAEVKTELVRNVNIPLGCSLIIN